MLCRFLEAALVDADFKTHHIFNLKNRSPRKLTANPAFAKNASI